MSDTPRTDSQLLTVKDCSYVAPHPSGEYVHADFARQLERDNATLRAEKNRWENAVRSCVEWSNGREYEWGDRAENAFGFLHAAINAARAKETQP